MEKWLDLYDAAKAVARLADANMYEPDSGHVTVPYGAMAALWTALEAAETMPILAPIGDDDADDDEDES